MEIFKSSFFAIPLILSTYSLGVWMHKKTNSPLVNPMVISMLAIILLLTVFGIPVEYFSEGASTISNLLIPATAVLAVKVYMEREKLMANFIPILVGCFAGAVTSIISVIMFSKLFGLDKILFLSSLPKSATTPIALEVSAMVGGIPSLTVALVVVTGIFGAVAGPVIIKLFHMKSHVCLGVAYGSASHAIGTSQALKISNDTGASSSVSIVITGMFIYLILFIMQNTGFLI